MWTKTIVQSFMAIIQIVGVYDNIGSVWWTVEKWFLEEKKEKYMKL